MKKLLGENKSSIFFIFYLLIVWRLFLVIPSVIAPLFIQQRVGFIGPTSWANFDGMHYLSIAQNGYFQFEQAFFPLFPLIIKGASLVTFGNYLIAGFSMVYLFLFLWLFVLYKLLQLDYKESTIRWILIGYLFFPTSFFLASLYTESLFLLLITSVFLAMRNKRFILAGVFVGLASATKLVGIFLLPALLFEYYILYKKTLFTSKRMSELVSMVIVSISGIVAYMIYLWKFYADPLFFIHAQPAFGANRTGGDIILLPQVLYRYIKIFLTVSFTKYDAWIAVLEFSMLIIVLGVLVFCFYKTKIKKSYLIFSLLAVIGPTLTGSLSSVPRYVLVAFPIFIAFGTLENRKIKICLLIACSILLILLTSYFLQGYFIA